MAALFIIIIMLLKSEMEIDYLDNHQVITGILNTSSCKFQLYTVISRSQKHSLGSLIIVW